MTLIDVEHAVITSKKFHFRPMQSRQSEKSSESH